MAAHIGLGGSPLGCLGGSVEWRGPTRQGRERFHGSFAEIEVEPGEVSLGFRLDVAPTLPVETFVVRAIESELVHLQVRLEVPTASISGTVRHEDGRIAADASVVAKARAPEGSGPEYDGRADAEGNFDIRVRDVGLSFTVQARGGGARAARLDVAPGTTGLELVLPRRYPLRFRCVDGPTGLPLGEKHLWLLGRGREGVFSRVPFGTIGLDGWNEAWFEEERVDLLFRPRNRNKRASHRFEFVRDVELRTKNFEIPCLELVFDPSSEVVLELDPRAGTWPEETELFLFEEKLLGWILPHFRDESDPEIDDLIRSRRAEFDANGRAVLKECPPGDYTFVTRGDPLDIHPPGLTLVRVPMGPVRIRWTPGERR